MNALVSYASDSDSDSVSDSGDVHPTTTATVVQKSVPSTPTVATTTSSTAPSKHHTPEGTPAGTRTLSDQDDTNLQQENRDQHPQQQQQDENAEEDDGFVSAALKDLQSFAASVDDSTTTAPRQGDDTPSTSVIAPVDVLPPTTAVLTVPGAQPPQDPDQVDSADMEVDQSDTAAAAASTTIVPQPDSPIELTTEQQIIFDTFLKETNAIPLLPLPSSIDQQPPLPPRTSSRSLHDATSTSASTSKTPPPAAAITNDDDEEWIQQQTPQTIYSRIHQLSTLPATERFCPKEVENRLIEFAIRLLDWEQGGLKPVYFLGQERANKEQRLKGDKKKEEEESGESSNDDEEEEGTILPVYGGVVGEMIEYMHAVEKIAPPDDHWSIVWSLKDLSYGFLHPATGTKSDEFPSSELRNRLNPPSSSSGTTTPAASS